jgi:hypothetical protein
MCQVKPVIVANILFAMLNFTAADAAAAGNPSKYHDV